MGTSNFARQHASTTASITFDVATRACEPYGWAAAAAVCVHAVLEAGWSSDDY